MSFSGAFEFMKIALRNRSILKGATIVQADESNLMSEVQDASVVIPFMLKINKDVLNAATSLKLIIQYGVGLEGVDIGEAKRRGILVGKIASSESANARSCAEHSVFLAMACFRRFNELQHSLRSRTIGHPTGRTLQGATAAIYGFGGIGRVLSPLLKALGMRVIVIVRDKSRWSETDLKALSVEFMFDELYSSSDWNDVAKSIDVIFLCCTLNPTSKNLVNKEFLSVTKPGVVLINVSRGGLLDYVAVRESVECGHIGGLGLDVFHTEPFPLPEEDGLLSHPRVVVTPHVAGVTESSHGQMAEIVVDNIERMLKGVPVKGLV